LLDIVLPVSGLAMMDTRMIRISAPFVRSPYLTLLKSGLGDTVRNDVKGVLKNGGSADEKACPPSRKGLG
jgi:hypothetical protein